MVPATFTTNGTEDWQPPEPAEATPPPPALLSLTVNLNFIALATGDKTSPFSPPIVAPGLVG